MPIYQIHFRSFEFHYPIHEMEREKNIFTGGMTFFSMDSDKLFWDKICDVCHPACHKEMVNTHVQCYWYQLNQLL